MIDNGVEVLSEPATVMIDEEHGSSFFCFKDPDGTYLELVQSFSANIADDDGESQAISLPPSIKKYGALR